MHYNEELKESKISEIFLEELPFELPDLINSLVIKRYNVLRWTTRIKDESKLSCISSNFLLNEDNSCRSN